MRSRGLPTVPGDRLTPKERAAAFPDRAAMDRLPCSPFLGEAVAPLFGVTTREYYGSAAAMAQVEIAAFREFRPDGVGIGISMRDMAEAMGLEITYPERGIALADHVLLPDYATLAGMEPIDPLTDGRLPVVLEALERLRESIGDEIDVGSGVVGPFTIAGTVRGQEALLRDMRTRPDDVHALLALITENNLLFIDTVAARGFDVAMSDPLASASVISPAEFRTFAAPYLGRCADRIRLKTGAGTGLHICGRSRQIWEDILALDIESLSIDNIESLAEARSALADRVALVGNIDPIGVMLLGTVSDVYDAVRECVAIAGDAPLGYEIATGCQVPIGTPRENIHAMMDAARVYGQFGTDGEILGREPAAAPRGEKGASR